MPFGLSLWNWELYTFLGADERFETFDQAPGRRTPALRVAGLRTPPGHRAGPAPLDGIDLTLAAGEIVVLTGSAGAGKSTLLRCLAQDEPGGEGLVEIEGTRAPRLSKAQRSAWRRKLALVTADDALLPSRSVARNLSLPLEIARWPRPQIERRVAELVGLLELEGLEQRYPSELSPAERLRVAIGRALARNAKVLLLDDVLPALSVALRNRIFSVLRTLSRQQGVAVLLAARDPASLEPLADRVLRLDGGRLAEAAAGPEPSLADSGALSPWPLPCGQAVLRLRFEGASAGQPVLSDLVRQQGLSVNLIEGSLGSSGGRPRGDLIVSLPFVGELTLQRAIDFLADRKVAVELLGHKAGHAYEDPPATGAGWSGAACLPIG